MSGFNKNFIDRGIGAVLGGVFGMAFASVLSMPFRGDYSMIIRGPVIMVSGATGAVMGGIIGFNSIRNFRNTKNIKKNW
jgi:hypothetical protein